MRDGTRDLSVSQHLAAAALAGAVTQVFVNPIWVVKTRMCAQLATDPDRYRSISDAFVRMYRGEGFRTFYRGMIPALASTGHGAVQFAVYEELKIRISRLKAKRNPDASLVRRLYWIWQCNRSLKMLASFSLPLTMP